MKEKNIKLGEKFMKRIATTALVLTTTILTCGCGAEVETTTTDITPKEPVSQTVQETVSEETETMETESEESIVEDTKIDESEAKEMLKSYSDKISEANIENYSEELVYAFTTNINEGKTEEESFNLALQHAIELRDFDLKTAEAEKARVEAEAREAEANKLAEQQAKKESISNENKEVVNGGSDNSVPLTAEESQAVEQAQPQPTPEPTPQAPTPAPTPAPQEEMSEAEKQAMADEMNAYIATITDPTHPLYGNHAFVVKGWE